MYQMCSRIDGTFILVRLKALRLFYFYFLNHCAYLFLLDQSRNLFPLLLQM